MVKSVIYDWMYRTWAPWDSVGFRRDLVDFISDRDITADRFPRTVDLGCGTGANVVYLAQQGHDSWGVDFSPVAIMKAEERAASAEVSPNFVVGDLTAGSIDDLEGPFDLLIDFGTLDDLKGEARKAMADTVTRLSRPGSIFLEYCFYGVTEELPWISFKGTSRMSHIAPGELEALFGDEWDVNLFREHSDWRIAIFELNRR